ncbi:MAG: serine/threonine-protein kinase [Candidatus Melainabacteria bacterium]|nr:serine/threonine-protein kinase [Candidatus Melainabacteria bacterium]
MDANARSLIIGKICPTCQFKYSPELDRCPDDNSLLAVVKRDPFIGKLIADKYKIVEILGMGGFSTVYKADQTSLRRSVAIKILHAEFVDKPDKIRRFQHEAESISTLVHSNVASVYDYGVLAEGQPYLVMELASGKTLSAVLAEAKVLPPERALEIFLQCCEGVAAAHNKGLIHRDLKPSNIVLLQAEDGSEHVKILDFGLAKVISGDEANRENLTMTGEVLGTPAYMAPEQCMGTVMDMRTDIYCFGCVMYEVLSGKLPLIGDTSYEVMHKHINEAPISLSKSGPAVPPRLVRIVSRCLQKDPDDRYQTFEDLKDALMGVEPAITSEIKTILFSGSNVKLSKKKKLLKKKVFLSMWTFMLFSLGLVGLLAFEHWQNVQKIEIKKQYADKISSYDNGKVSFDYPATFHTPRKKEREAAIMKHFERRDAPDVFFDLKHLNPKQYDQGLEATAIDQRDKTHKPYQHFVEIKPIQKFAFGKDKLIQGYDTEFIHDQGEAYRRERHVYFGRPGSIWKLKVYYPLSEQERCEKAFDIIFNTAQLHDD